MSGRKKEIHVKDLVIKADNVVFEPPKRGPVDPFFGPRRHDDDVEMDVDVEVDEDKHDDEESSSSSSSDKERNRPPFSWI